MVLRGKPLRPVEVRDVFLSERLVSVEFESAAVRFVFEGGRELWMFDAGTDLEREWRWMA